MKDTKKKKKVNTERENQHNLNQQQLERLIAAKFERARMYHEAMRKREALTEESR